MPKDMKRMNYFNGLLLKEEDLTLDQIIISACSGCITVIFMIGESWTALRLPGGT